MTKKNELEFEIIDMFELKGTLRIVTKCKYGIDKFGLSLKSTHVDPATNEPRFIPELREKLRNKYENNVRKEVQYFKKLKGKKFKVICDGS